MQPELMPHLQVILLSETGSAQIEKVSLFYGFVCGEWPGASHGWFLVTFLMLRPWRSYVLRPWGRVLAGMGGSVEGTPLTVQPTSAAVEPPPLESATAGV